jgi:hypothetical protein
VCEEPEVDPAGDNCSDLLPASKYSLFMTR